MAKKNEKQLMLSFELSTALGLPKGQPVSPEQLAAKVEAHTQPTAATGPVRSQDIVKAVHDLLQIDRAQLDSDRDLKINRMLTDVSAAARQDSQYGVRIYMLEVEKMQAFPNLRRLVDAYAPPVPSAFAQPTPAPEPRDLNFDPKLRDARTYLLHKLQNWAWQIGQTRWVQSKITGDPMLVVEIERDLAGERKPRDPLESIKSNFESESYDHKSLTVHVTRTESGIGLRVLPDSVDFMAAVIRGEGGWVGDVAMGWVDRESKPVGTWRHDLGERPKMDWFWVAKTVLWRAMPNSVKQVKEAKAKAKDQGSVILIGKPGEPIDFKKFEKDLLALPEKKKQAIYDARAKYHDSTR